mmetsp:Transcript_57379/g.140032  ORF Transcript_57379/g.140032 Transcript_57379/m.140032 type:complete len:684 (-) Transcript_57379:1703-3754(-)
MVRFSLAAAVLVAFASLSISTSSAFVVPSSPSSSSSSQHSNSGRYSELTPQALTPSITSHVFAVTTLYASNEDNSEDDEINDDGSDDKEAKSTKSAAKEWQEKQQQQQQQQQAVQEGEDEVEVEVTEEPKKKTKIAIVGGGWGGWGAAKAICESKEDVEVTLLDALPDPTGSTPFLSSTGKPVEAGTRGFWKDYPNINSLCAQLGLKESDIFTDFTNSSFYSPDGLEATAPVFSEGKLPQIDLPFFNQFSGQSIPQLPSPLGQVLATFPLFERIPLSDRASMVGLLLATVDCLGNDISVQEKYDRMTAHDLFIQFGLSERLVEDFIKPTLLVGLFKPPEELSALVVMELLYYYALAHQDSFDVRWIKNGTVSDSLIAPMAEYLQDEYDLQVKGGAFVNKISLSSSPSSSSSTTTIEYKTRDGKASTMDVDGIVLALNGKGMSSVMESSPDLSQYSTFSQAASMKNGIDVISCRIWLDTYVPTRTPANVFSRFEALRGAGGTFFMLDQFQKENEQALWGEDGEPQGSVLACDFYNAGGLMSLSDDAIVDILMKELLPDAVPQFASAKVVDSWVGKFPGSVSFFSPGSFRRRPPLQGDPNVPQIKFAGDWVRMGDLEHGAKGLCQERAFVSGLQAGNLLVDELISKSRLYKHPIIPVREDEAQFKAAIAVNKQIVGKLLPRFWVR